MKKFFLFLFLFVHFAGQSQDLIILRSGVEINCKVTKVDSAVIHYEFFKGERKLSSYVLISDVRSYEMGRLDGLPDNSLSYSQVQDKKVIIDTSKYVKETSQWINLITYSQRYGLHADGWTLQYYGYNLTNKAKWIFPLIFGIELFELHADYFEQSEYQAGNMSYFSGGISPFYKLTKYLYLNIDLRILFGDEEITDFYSRETSHSFIGISHSQGIYFIPKSRFGIVAGLSLNEKLLSSKVYKNDLGLKLEVGLKF